MEIRENSQFVPSNSGEQLCYRQGQIDLLKIFEYFVHDPLKNDDEINLVIGFLKNNCELSTADKLNLPRINDLIHKDRFRILLLLIDLEPEEIEKLFKIICDFRRLESNKKEVQKIINEIGIDNLYEIINELDGKSDENQ